MRRLTDRRALGGPVEDLTSLMVVSIGVAILLATLAAAFTSWTGDRELEPEEVLNDLILALRNYNKLLEENVGQGVFSDIKLSTMDASLIAMDLNIGCEFSLTFRERSGYTTGLEYSAMTRDIPGPGEEDIIFRTVPVGIYSGSSVHAAVLTVAVWGF